MTDAGTPVDSGPLSPGTYDVNETVPEGWDLTVATCDDGSVPAAIELQAGETVICTFENTKLGSIIVEKQVTFGDTSKQFSFSGDASGSISDGEQIIVTDLPPGAHTSAENLPEGWQLTDNTCDDDDSSGDINSGQADYQLASGETVTCVFTNSELQVEPLEPEPPTDLLLTAGPASGVAGSGPDGRGAMLLGRLAMATAILAAGWTIRRRRTIDGA